jgi:hypothetical protein
MMQERNGAVSVPSTLYERERGKAMSRATGDDGGAAISGSQHEDVKKKPG